MKKIISIIAAIFLTIINGILSIVQFLGNDEMQVSLLVSFVLLMILSFYLHKKWIIFAAQTSIFLYPIYGNIRIHMIESDVTIVTSNQYSFLYSLTIIAFSYFLAWLVARSI
jgi:hypothetical protein